MQEVAIGILHHRRNFEDTILHYLGKMKPENKKLCKLFFLTSQRGNFDKKCEATGIDYSVVHFNFGHNFMAKINTLLTSGLKYSLRTDEDTFVSNHVYDYMIENRDVLNSENYMLMAPLLMNGVPTVELFNQDFLLPKEREELEEIYLNTTITKIGNLIHPNYQENHYELLNKHTIYSNKWDSRTFFSDVAKIPHYYRGLHPQRINYKAQEYLNNFTLNNIHLFKKDNSKHYWCDPNYFSDSCYHCNACHLVKNDMWKRAITEFPDGFDETSVNRFREKNDLAYLFIRNSYAVNTYYSNITEVPDEMNPHSNKDGKQSELDFYDKFSQLVFKD